LFVISIIFTVSVFSQFKCFYCAPPQFCGCPPVFCVPAAEAQHKIGAP